MRAPQVVSACAFALGAAPVAGQESGRQAERARFAKQIRPVLIAHCYGCHSQEAAKPKGDFRLDQLAPDFAGEANAERWLTVLQQVKAGEMPPKSKRDYLRGPAPGRDGGDSHGDLTARLPPSGG
jgi:hypothetical protein